MNRFLAVSAFALFSFMVAGTAMAQQERAVLQEGFQTGSGGIGSGPGGGIDNSWIRELLVKPETIFGRLLSKDLPGGKFSVETGGGSFVSVRVNDKTNLENFKAVHVGDDVEIQAYRNYRKLSSGAFSADIPEGGEAYALDVTVIREAVNPSALVPQAGYQPDTDRGINASSNSISGGVGGQCFQCYEGQASSYGK